VGAGTEPHFIDGLLDEIEAGFIDFTKLADLSAVQLRIGAEVQISVTLVLSFAGANDVFAHGVGVGAVAIAGEFAERYGGDFDVDVDTVDEGAGDAGEVSFDLVWGALAGSSGIGEVATGAGIHGGDKHDVGGEG